MKKGIKNPVIFSVLLTGLGLILAGRGTAQPFTTLHNFVGTDGANPRAALVISSNMLFGTTIYGGSGSEGTVFKLKIDGTSFTNIYTFTPTSNGTNSDGANPSAALLLSNGVLYGTAEGGGFGGWGTIFRINTDGTGFTNLHSFTGNDGLAPAAGLVLSGNTLYGTTRGGRSSNGTVFAIKTDGTAFTNLLTSGGSQAKLTLSGTTLYGTAAYLFRIETDGTGFTNLHILGPNSPVSDLMICGNTLYGTVQSGGPVYGSVFAVNTDGTDFTNLFTFTYDDSFNGYPDGAYPVGGLELSGHTLYGTTSGGGTDFAGVVFQVNADGTCFRIIHNFSGSEGVSPYGGLILSGNMLYGTTFFGSSDNGTVFSLFLPPQLTIIPSGQSVILTWPTNYSGFMLQSTTNVLSPVWTTNSPPPVVVNGQNTVTHSISGTQQFFRLSQ